MEPFFTFSEWNTPTDGGRPRLLNGPCFSGFEAATDALVLGAGTDRLLVESPFEFPEDPSEDPACTNFRHALADKGAQLRGLQLDNIGLARFADLRLDKWGENLEELRLCRCRLGEGGAKALASALKKCTNLHYLALTRNCNTIGDEGAQALAAALVKCPKLQHFGLTDERIEAKGMEALAAALEKCANLSSLDLSETDLGEGVGSPLFAAIARCPNLKRLDLHLCEMDEAAIQALAKGLANCAKLEYLNISEWSPKPLSLAALESLASALTRCPNLQELYLADLELGDGGIQQLAPALARCTVLDLTWNNVGMAGAQALAATVAASPNLKCLNFSSNRGRPPLGIPALLEGVARCTDLRILNLHGTSMTSKSIQALALALEKFPYLQVLDLSGNRIDAKDAKKLSCALAKCTRLERLSFEDCMLYPEGVKALASILPKCTALERLSFGWNSRGMDADAAASLGSALAKCTRLTWLDLGNKTLSEESAQGLAAGLAKCTSLEQLDVLNCLDLEDDGVSELALALQNCTQLRRLRLTNCYVGANGVEAMAALLPVFASDAHVVLGFQLKGISADSLGVAFAKGLVRRGSERSIQLHIPGDFKKRGTRALASALLCLHPNSRLLGEERSTVSLTWTDFTRETRERRAVFAFLAGAASSGSAGAAANRFVRRDGDGAIVRRVLGVLVGA